MLLLTIGGAIWLLKFFFIKIFRFCEVFYNRIESNRVETNCRTFSSGSTICIYRNLKDIGVRMINLPIDFVFSYRYSCAFNINCFF